MHNFDNLPIKVEYKDISVTVEDSAKSDTSPAAPIPVADQVLENDFLKAEISRRILSKNANCIFSYNMRQYLDNKEFYRNIPQQIESLPSIASFKLTDKIRTNKEIASFIRLLFDKNKQKTTYNYSNVEVGFFNDRQKAKQFLPSLQNSGWRIPQYTPGKATTFQYEDYLINGENSTHAVIGQEIERVVAVIDEYFGYSLNGMICSTASTKHMNKIN